MQSAKCLTRPSAWHLALFAWHLALLSGSLSLAEDDVDSTALDPQWLAPTREVDAKLLSRGIQPEEAAGYFAILNHVRQISLKQLRESAQRFESERRSVIQNDPAMRFYFRQANAEFPTFVDLHRSPTEYHGRPVTLRGHVRRLIELPAGPNPFGFERLYEAWLYADEAQQNPAVVVCSDLPTGLQTGGDVLVDFVSVTGYFFKRYGYSDQSGQWRFAPLILASKLNWSPQAERTPWLSSTTMWWLVTAVGGLVFWFGCRAIRQSNARRLQRAALAIGEDFLGIGSESRLNHWVAPSTPTTATDTENPDRCGSD